uniref:Protein TRANSPORT INHIBITOR RESPONSE 1-like n=1 Tax=Nicotiana tabacum TaxID=4097 RepID=A0A1S3Y8A9_TOBAC|nr:PREDICTED: protein TRANSPORT INHIBITOR RESPONSE 1-like [Nicotiana tabacum]
MGGDNNLAAQAATLVSLAVLDYIEDTNLHEIVTSCKNLRYFLPSQMHAQEPNVSLTEQGLVAVCVGFPKLHSPQTPDYLVLGPLDAGFGAILQHCKGLRRLLLSGLLMDLVVEYIKAHAKKLEMLSVTFAGDSALGLYYVLSGCESLHKLEIRDCPLATSLKTS